MRGRLIDFGLTKEVGGKVPNDTFTCFGGQILFFLAFLVFLEAGARHERDKWTM